jgi:hypothetical protein
MMATWAVALDGADEGHRHVHQAARDAAAVHDLADQDEQRDGDEPIAVHPREHLHGEGLEQHGVAGAEDVGNARDAQAHADGHAHHEGRAEEEGSEHGAGSGVSSRRRR